MSRKDITSSDIDSLVEDFGGRKLTISNQESKRKIRKRSFQVDGDDSTDDEKVTESVAKYKIEESWKDFKGNLFRNDYKKSIDDRDLKYSFILHAFGRGVYYSEPVNAIYEVEGGLKPNYLSRSESRSTRKTLSQTEFPINHQEFESEIDYIANRRMTDRSEKRIESNGISLPDERKDFKSKQWKMPLTTWNFSSKESIEVKGVKKKTNTSRDDWTLYQGEEIPYTKKKSNNWVENVATNLSGIPQDDAEQIRAILRGDRIEADAQKLEKLSFLTNLFFGSETVRSPVGFVSHQMFLDLIGSNQVGFKTWKKAFDGNFPQMGEGAINALRLLNDDYNGSMPYNYRYDANRGFEDERIFKGSPLSPQQQSQQTAKSIINAEAKIAKSWLALKFPDEPQTPETLMKVLPTQIQEWYRGVDLSHFIDETINKSQTELKNRKPINFDRAATAPSNLNEMRFSKDKEEYNNKDQFDRLQSSVSTPVRTTNYTNNNTNFNEEYQFFDKDDLVKIYEEISNKKAQSDPRSSLGLISDDERFLILWCECEQNGFDFDINREGGFAEIKRDKKTKVICPINSIELSDNELDSKVIKFVQDHENKNTIMILSIKDKDGYKILALNPNDKEYRYIDSTQDSEDGKIEHKKLKSIINNLGYSRIEVSYEKQQNLDETGRVNSNECVFHSIYNMIRIAQSNNTIGSHLHAMNRYGMKMLGQSDQNLTAEFVHDNLEPFYDQFFDGLRKEINSKKKQEESQKRMIENKKSLFINGNESKEDQKEELQDIIVSDTTQISQKSKPTGNLSKISSVNKLDEETILSEGFAKKLVINPKEEVKKLTEEQIDRVGNNGAFYADDELNFIIQSQITDNTQYIAPAIVAIPEEFNRSLINFRNDLTRSQAIIAIAADNHFTGIHIRRSEEGTFSITYFDPTISSDGHPLHEIPNNVSTSLNENFPNTEIVKTNNVIQTSSEEANIITIDNNHCGAFVAYFLTEMTNGNIRLNPDGSRIMQRNSTNGWNDIENLNQEQSDELGKLIRKFHTEFLIGNGSLENQDILLSSFLSNLQTKKQLKNWCDKAIKKEPNSFSKENYDELSELVKKSDLYFNQEQKDIFSKASVQNMRSLKDSQDKDLKRSVDKFLAQLSEKDLLNPNYVDNSWPMPYRAASYEYKKLFNSTFKKCDKVTLEYKHTRNSDKTTLQIIEQNGWTKEAKELNQIINSETKNEERKPSSENKPNDSNTFQEMIKKERNNSQERKR